MLEVVRLALLILAGCAWSDSINRMAATPDPHGPCLQIVHPSRRRWDLYKGAQFIGPNIAESYDRAFADYPASRGRLASSQHEASTVIIGATGMTAGVATLAAGMFAGSDVTIGVGLGTMATTMVTAGVLALLFDPRWGESVAEYNTWAATQGCGP